MSNINIEMREHGAKVFADDNQIGMINFKTNSFHNQNCYLDLQFEYWDLNISKSIFDMLRYRI